MADTPNRVEKATYRHPRVSRSSVRDQKSRIESLDAINALTSALADAERRQRDLTDPDSQALQSLHERVAELWEDFVENSDAPLVHDLDRSMFQRSAKLTLEKMRAIVRGHSDALTSRTFASLVRRSAAENYRGKRIDEVRNHIGTWLFQSGRFFLPVPTIRDLGAVRRRTVIRRAPIHRETGEVETTRRISQDNLPKDDVMTRVCEQILTVVRLDWEGNNTPMPLYELILNQRSYAQTVENLFFVSFLVKDQRLALIPSRKGLPLVTHRVRPRIANPTSNEHGTKSRDEQALRNQVALSMTYELWERLCQYFGEVYPDNKEPHIPHRFPRAPSQDIGAPNVAIEPQPPANPQ